MAEVRDGLNDLPAPFVRMGVAIDSTANEVPEETYETCGFHFQALRLCFLTALVFWAGQCARISVNAQTPPPAATITSVDAKTGLVTARINASGQLFQFTLTSKALLNRVHPGQDVYVNLRKRQVSLDGRTAAGTIVSLQELPTGGGAAGSAAPASPSAPPSGAAPPPASLALKVAIFQLPSLGGEPGIPGGEQISGTVVLAGSAAVGSAVGGTVHLSSSRPDVATVPPEIAVARLNTPVKFTVNTIPVTTTVEVNISAQLANNSNASSAKLIVRPPQVAGIDCSPRQLVGGDSTHCKVWLDGRVAGVQTIGSRTPAGAPATVTIGTSDSQVTTGPRQVGIAQGQSSAEFDVFSAPHPDTIPVTLSASYGSLQKSVTLTFTPAAISSLYCRGDQGGMEGGCRQIVWGNPNDPDHQASVQVKLTAPAPSQGYVIHLSSNSPVLGVSGNMVVAPSQELSNPFKFQEHAVAKETQVTITVQDPLSGEKKTILFDIEPPRADYIHFANGQNTIAVSNVPIGGKQLMARVLLYGVTPSNGMNFDVQYQWKDSAGESLSATDIQGPRTITVPGSTNNFGLNFAVPPCGINPPCKAVVIVGGGAEGTVIVNP